MRMKKKTEKMMKKWKKYDLGEEDCLLTASAVFSHGVFGEKRFSPAKAELITDGTGVVIVEGVLAHPAVADRAPFALVPNFQPTCRKRRVTSSIRQTMRPHDDEMSV